MTHWTLTEKGRELLEKYVKKDIGFAVSDLKDNKLFGNVLDDNFINILDEKLDRKSVYSTKAVSMKHLIKCFSEQSVVWGIKMNLLIGILLYNDDLNADKLSKKLRVTKATVKEHILLLKNCDLIKKKDTATHLSDFM
ncbi:hypothetical protein BEH94_09130 [Candidatus Altiarchaeales archaeon WOR_SM1_SCG]|nr:hypothetical protein BEH94_09130 [Candidatus Altiarchaeales archaeon WOR_SM1_SCG]